MRPFIILPIIIQVLIMINKVQGQAIGSLIRKPIIDEYTIHKDDTSFIDKFCIHFYFNDTLYMLSHINSSNFANKYRYSVDKYASETAYSNEIYLWNVFNKNLCSGNKYLRYNDKKSIYNIEPVFVSAITLSRGTFNIEMDFSDYPQSLGYGNALTHVFNDSMVLITQIYELKFSANVYYHYPVFVLLKKTYNYPVEFEVLTRYFPRTISNTFAKSITRINNELFEIEMNNGDKIELIIYNDEYKFCYTND